MGSIYGPSSPAHTTFARHASPPLRMRAAPTPARPSLHPRSSRRVLCCAPPLSPPRPARPPRPSLHLLHSPPPLVLFEDEHLLVVNKPRGWGTHSPAPLAAEGAFDWLRARELRWSTLAIHSRLDRGTSGVLLFGLSQLANRSLSAQFAARSVEKRYVLTSSGGGGGGRGRAWPPAGDRNVRVVCEEATGEGDGGWARVACRLSRLPRSEKRLCSASVGDEAVTLFRVLSRASNGNSIVLEARPLTGRTHQIRAHAAAIGYPIDGDELYGAAHAAQNSKIFSRFSSTVRNDEPPLRLHAASLSIDHPFDGRRVTFEAPIEGEWSVADAIIGADTTFFRLGGGSFPPCPGDASAVVDILGPIAVVSSEAARIDGEWARKLLLRIKCGATQQNSHGGSGGGIVAVFHRRLRRDVRRLSSSPPLPPPPLSSSSPLLPLSLPPLSSTKTRLQPLASLPPRPSSLPSPPPPDGSPSFVCGSIPPSLDCSSIPITENGVTFLLSLVDGYSLGLFGDMRDTRRRVLTGYVAPGFGLLPCGTECPTPSPSSQSHTPHNGVPPSPPAHIIIPRPEFLNVFAYTCGFSVVAALAGWRSTSLDASKKYLAWGNANLEANGIDPSDHDAIFGDASHWLARLGKKGRRFECVVLDPPTVRRACVP